MVDLKKFENVDKNFENPPPEKILPHELITKKCLRDSLNALSIGKTGEI